VVLRAIRQWNEPLADLDREEKYAKMAESDFGFYRGTNHLFWADFAGDGRIHRFGGVGTRTWLQGDLHTDNFGAFGNDEGEVVYDLNDFDESVIADYQYDLWRMAVSIVLVARRHDDLSSKQQEDVVDRFTESYLDQLASYADDEEDREHRVVFDRDHTYGRLDNFLEEVEEESSRRKMLEAWTRVDGGVRFFDPCRSEGKLGRMPPALYGEILAGMRAYQRTLVKTPEGYHDGYFEVKDIARRLLAGTGSLGVPRYYVLIAGESASSEDDRILDVKHQVKPTPYHFLDECEQREYRRLVRFPGGDAKWHEAAYRALAKHTDDHLGWMRLSDGFYSVRERSLFKETFPTEILDSKTRFSKLAEQWGIILATDHARALSAFDSEYPLGFRRNRRFKEEVSRRTDGLHDEFRALVREIAFGYADQVHEDWHAFVDAFSSCEGGS
jgi:uncharacterized protein (DUF2252 family)